MEGPGGQRSLGRSKAGLETLNPRNPKPYTLNPNGGEEGEEEGGWLAPRGLGGWRGEARQVEPQGGWGWSPGPRGSQALETLNPRNPKP